MCLLIERTVFGLLIIGMLLVLKANEEIYYIAGTTSVFNKFYENFHS